MPALLPSAPAPAPDEAPAPFPDFPPDGVFRIVLSGFGEEEALEGGGMWFMLKPTA